MIVPVLNGIGFSAVGPVAGEGWFFLDGHISLNNLFCYRSVGTFAAGVQASIGNVAAGSLFAMAQSTAMGAGVAVAFPAIGGAVTGGLTVAGIAVHEFVKSTALDAKIAATLVASREAATRSVTMASAAAYEFLNFSQTKERLPPASRWFRRPHQPVGV